MAGTSSLKEYYKYLVFIFLFGFGATVWGAMTYFIGIPVAYLTYLKANSMQVGLITALFWAGFALPQIWAAYKSETKTIKKKYMAGVIFLSSISWLLLSAYIFVTGASNAALSIWLFLGLFAWACALTGMFWPAAFSLLFKIIPTEKLGQLIGIMFAVQFAGSFLAGFLITSINKSNIEPGNYTVLFILTFLISIVGCLILLMIKEPEGEKIEGSPSFGAYITKCVDIVKTDKLLVKFIIGKWLMTGHYIMMAFLLAYLIAERGFDPINSGLFTKWNSFGLFIGGFTITKIADIYGPKQMLITSHIIAVIYTVLAWLVPSSGLTLILVAFVISGITQISDNVGYSNMCMFCCPTEDKSTYVAVTNVGVNLLTIPLPIIFGVLMDAKVLTYSGTFSIVLAMMIAAIIYMIVVVENPKAFLDMKKA